MQVSLTPAATMPRQVPPSLRKGCERERPCPALPCRYEPVSRRVGRRSRQWRSGSRTAGGFLPDQCADPQDTTPKPERRGAGISPRLTPAFGL